MRMTHLVQFFSWPDVTHHRLALSNLCSSIWAVRFAGNILLLECYLLVSELNQVLVKLVAIIKKSLTEPNGRLSVTPSPKQCV